MIKRSMIVAGLLGIFAGLILFIYTQKVTAQPRTDIVKSVTLYDRTGTLLYEGPGNPDQNMYKRAPYAVGLVLRNIPLDYQKVTTTIDLGLQQTLQAWIIEQAPLHLSVLVTAEAESGDRDILAALNSGGPGDLLSFEKVNVVFHPNTCTTPGQKTLQTYVFATDENDQSIDTTNLKTALQDKINEYQLEKGGELYD